MRVPTAITACALLAGLALPTQASASSCSAEAGPPGAGDSSPRHLTYLNLQTTNVSCTKGAALMRAFARRYRWPPPRNKFTTRINGFKCKVRLSVTDSGPFPAYGSGSIVCRKGTRTVRWRAFGDASSAGGGAG